MQKITIIGLGWLGMPLALHLMELGYTVTGSKSTPAGTEQARSVGVNSIHVDFIAGQAADVAQLQRLLTTDVLIITLPAKRDKKEAENYRSAVLQLADIAAKQQVKRLIFLSSTAVYADQTGCLSEDSILQPTTLTGQILLELERKLRENKVFTVDVLRLAGLVGRDRHPGRFLAGKSGLSGGNTGVNLVHQHDVIAAIICLLQQPQGGHIFNLCAPQHPKKRDFYPKMARQLGLPEPQFTDETTTQDERLIDGSKICQQLGFHYLWPCPEQMTFA